MLLSLVIFGSLAPKLYLWGFDAPLLIVLGFFVRIELENELKTV